MKIYFSADGSTQYGEKYKHLSTHEVEMPEKPEEKEGHRVVAKMNPETLEGYWEEREIKKSPEEEIEDLKKESAEKWYSLMGKEFKIEQQENEIAELWYELMTTTGGM